MYKLKMLFICVLLFVSNIEAKNVSLKQCETNKGTFIFAGNECIEYFISKGDKEDSLNIIVHGTWKEGTNVLGRYSTFAEDIAMQTDITSIVVALPGYSKSSSNHLQALGNKKVKNLAGTKKYLNFLGKLLQALKTKYKAKTLNYIGHSAGAMMGATLTGYKTNVIDNLVSIGGIYDIHKKSTNKNLISVVDVIDNIKKDTKILLIYGSKDKVSKPKITKDFYILAKNKKIDVQIVEVKNAVHLDLDMTDESIEAITDFLDY